MAVAKIIVSGKLDYADGQYLIRDDRTHKTRQLGYHIDAYLGQTLVISVEEPERELDPIISKRLLRAMAPA